MINEKKIAESIVRRASLRGDVYDAFDGLIEEIEDLRGFVEVEMALGQMGMKGVAAELDKAVGDFLSKLRRIKKMV